MGVFLSWATGDVGWAGGCISELVSIRTHMLGT